MNKERTKKLIDRIRELENNLKLEKENNKHRVNLLKNSPSLHFLISNEGQILEFYGDNSELYKKPSEFLNKNISDVLPKEVSKKFQETFSKSSKKSSRIEYSLDFNDKNQDYSARIKKGYDNTLIICINEITERKVLEREKEKMLDNLKHLNSERDKIYRVIAHDLRSPFNGIIGISELLLEGLQTDFYSKEEILDFAKEISNQGNKMYNLLNNLLEFASISEIKYSPEEVNLRSIISDVQIIQQSNLERYNIKFHNMIHPEVKPYCDYRMCSSIFRNLISNSIKFTPEKGEIYASSKELDDSYVISIKDTGIGMNKHTLENLFNTEINVQKDGLRGEHSSGLGLDIVKNYVELNRGEIKVESIINKETTFYIKLPKK